MALYVDEARWEFRGHQWCHLVSDADLDELHAFAAAVGLDVRAFHGDHYDLPDEWRARAIGLGARPVPAREIVRILRAAGLRLSPAQRRAAVQG